jgi:hypothetical protein
MAITVEQLLAMPIPSLAHGQLWGVWQFDSERLALVHTLNGYEIDLEDIGSSAAMLDWVYQVQGWATSQEMADLLQALRRTFSSPKRICAQAVETSALRTDGIPAGPDTRSKSMSIATRTVGKSRKVLT